MTESAIPFDVVQRRLREIREILTYLRGLGEVTSEDLTGDIERRMAVERALTHLVDLAVKINSSLLTAATGIPPVDDHESFTKAGEAGVIPTDLTTRLTPSAGLRNRLVHEYDTIDYAQVAESIRTATSQYGEYVREVASYLARLKDEQDEGGDTQGGGTSYA